MCLVSYVMVSHMKAILKVANFVTDWISVAWLQILQLVKFI